MSRIKLWLVRHGETEVNSGIWSANPTQTRLTLKGKEQAAQSAMQVIEQPDMFFVSPLIRAKETMQFFIDLWPDTPVSIVPIQEFICLSPSRLSVLDPAVRKEQIKEYWGRNDPFYCDGDDAESFASFLQRIALFHQEIIQQQGYIIVVGHGQFLKAYQFGLIHGFTVSAAWMQLYHEKETSEPIKNGEIVKIDFN